VTPLGNVPLDQPFLFVRGTGGFSLIFQLRNGPQPVLPTDPIPPKTDLSQNGTYILFMVKKFDVDPNTAVPPMPDWSRCPSGGRTPRGWMRSAIP
jgi:hypothetical protein